MMDGRRLIAVSALAGLLTACAAKAPPTRVGPARYPNYAFPTVPAQWTASAAARHHQDAWLYLQNGDLLTALEEFREALREDPDFYPATTGLAYVELASQTLAGALSRFDGVLDRVPAYAPAWVGRAETLLALDREADAIVAFESALAADPTLADIRRRVEVLRFRNVQRALDRARAARDAGDLTAAREAYELALASAPDSAVLYRELAGVERLAGSLGAALEHVVRAIALEPDSAEGYLQHGDILEALGDLDGAEQAYRQAEVFEPSPEVAARLSGVRERLRLSRLPPEYHAIEGAEAINRGELAALVGVRLEPLVQLGRSGSALITDTRNHWALDWVLAVADAGIMEIYANHTFQPDALVERRDLAQVVSRVLDLGIAFGVLFPGEWQAAEYTFADVAPAHLSYPAVSAAVASGVLPLLDGNTFQLTRPVSGDEAVAAIDRLEQLIERGS